MQKLTPDQRTFFNHQAEVHMASAPGRLDVMGGIADYSGSYVLQMPIAERTCVYCAKRNDGAIRIHSAIQQAGIQPEFGIQIQELVANSKRIIRKLARESSLSWSLYVLGCIIRLVQQYDIPCQGVDIWVSSNIPVGKGVSSSAALEVASLQALCSAYSLTLSGNELPRLAQEIENNIVGAPCGIMDQLAVFHGRKKRLLPILCRSDLVEAPLTIPEGISFIGIDSGVRHSVGGASYSDVRTAAFMGYSIIAASHGVSATTLQKFRTQKDRTKIPHHGYLTEISPSAFERQYHPLFTETMSGKEFQSRGLVSIDDCTTVWSDKQYSILNCSLHPIHEHYRVQQFRYLLMALAKLGQGRSARVPILIQLGELMYQAHESYSRCGLGSEATDSLVVRSVEYGPKHGIYGAKITGGGSGGSVCLLCAGKKGVRTAKLIAQEHARSFNTEAVLFCESSQGAALSKPCVFHNT